MLVTFLAYGRTASCTFKCLACQKDKRKRTFRAEHTVNPFNTNPDGTQKPPAQVAQESQADANRRRDQFMVYPLCKACEDARSWSEMRSINARRRASETVTRNGGTAR